MTPMAFLCNLTTCLRRSWSCSRVCFLAFSFSMRFGLANIRKVHTLLGRINSVFRDTYSLPGVRLVQRLSAPQRHKVSKKSGPP